jgi:sialate O-acetylesterase
MKWFASVAVVLLSIASARAEVTVGTPFSSGMVLRRDVKLPVWGKAAAGEKVTVDFAGQSKSATADESGKWMLHLDPLAVSAEGRAMKITAGQTITLSDVLTLQVSVRSRSCCGGSGTAESSSRTASTIIRSE